MYENYFPSINTNVIGFAAFSKQAGNLVHLAYIDYQKAFTVGNGVRCGIYTGRYVTRGNQTFYQIEFEAYLKDDTGTVHKFGYVDGDTSLFYAEKVGEKSASTKMMIELIANNKTILENNLICAALIDKLDVANIDIPNEWRSGLVSLQTNLQARDKHISDSIFIDKKEVAAPQGLDKYGQTLSNFMADPGIGAIYLLFRGDHSQSKTDIIYSKDLTATLLKKLTPEEYQQLITENQDNAQKIADAASGNSLLNTAKYLGIGFLGFTLIDKFLQSRQTK